MDRLTLVTGSPRRRHEASDRIADERHIPLGSQRAESDSIALKRLRDDRRNERTRALARAKCIERPQGGHWRRERPIVALRQLVSSDFRRRIWRLSLQRMALVDRCP